MGSQSVLFNVAWEQAPEHMLLEGGVRVPTDILLVHIALQPSKGVSLSCVRPRTCVSNIWQEPLTPRAYLKPCNLPYILSPLPWAHVRTWVILFPSYPVPCASFFESTFGNVYAFSNQFFELIVLHVYGFLLFFFIRVYLIYHIVFQVYIKMIHLYIYMCLGFPLGSVVKESP